jgi:hypothetical protein
MRRQTYRNRSLRTSAGRLTEAWRPGVMIWIWQALRNGLTRRREGDHFPKIQAGSLFLAVRRLDTALDFSHRRAPPHPKLRQAGALHDTLMATKRLGQLRHLAYPQPFAPSRLRVRPLPLLPYDRPHLQISAFPKSLATHHSLLASLTYRIPPTHKPSTHVSRLSTQSPYLRVFPTSGFRFKYDGKGLASIPRLGEGRI